MKKLDVFKYLFLLVFIVIMILFSCNSNQMVNESQLSSYLKGNHELRRFKTIEKQESNLSGEFFLIGGTINGKTTTETLISFSWKLNSGEYCITELPLSKIRIHIDSTIITPYVKFKWAGADLNIDDIQFILDKYVKYMIVYCKEEDFPYSINLKSL